MKKSIVVILAVAIIGVLGIYSKTQSHPNVAPTPAQVQADSTSATADSTSSASQPAAAFKDGTYTGSTAYTVYGPVKIAVVVSGGKITDINFLQMPSDRPHSRDVTAFAEPYLKNETLKLQNSHIDFVTGATQTSEGYEQSLQAALDQAA